MALIRQSSSVNVVRFSLRDIEGQAAAILGDARREAERIIEEARKKAAELCEPASPDVSEVPADDLFAARGSEVEAALASLESAVEAIPAVLEELEGAVLNDVVELSIAISERITKRAGMIDPGVLEENLREAIKVVVRANGVRIAIHPQQIDLLNELLSSLKLEWPLLAGAQIVPDETVTPGGCRISTSHGQINADLQFQLDRLAAKLLPQRAEGGT